MIKFSQLNLEPLRFKITKLIILLLLTLTIQTISAENIYVVKYGSIKKVVKLSGTIEPRYEVVLVARSAGEVKSFPKEEGDFVKAGELLCLIDDKIPMTKLKQLYRTLEKAKLQIEINNVKLKRLKRDLNRAKVLAAKNLSSKEEVLTLEENIEELKLQNSIQATYIKEIMAQIEEASEELSYCKVYAPIDGYIAKKFVEKGTAVSGVKTSAGGSKLALIVSNTFMVKAWAQEQDVLFIKPGMTADVILPNQTRIKGTVKKVLNYGLRRDWDAVANGNYFPIIIEAKHLPYFTGLGVAVEIVVQRNDQALVIPRSFLITEPSKEGVKFFVLKKTISSQDTNDSTSKPQTKNLVKTPVKVGIVSNWNVEIKSGLTEGDTIVMPTLSKELLEKLKKRKIKLPSLKRKKNSNSSL